MSDQVEVTLAHPYDGKKPGDTIKVSKGESKRLIRGGIGAATKSKPAASDKPPKN